jgi:ubiquinone/menaquinone biosynthesis C-methylase UbiE
MIKHIFSACLLLLVIPLGIYSLRSYPTYFVMKRIFSVPGASSTRPFEDTGLRMSFSTSDEEKRSSPISRSKLKMGLKEEDKNELRELKVIKRYRMYQQNRAFADLTGFSKDQKIASKNDGVELSWELMSGTLKQMARAWFVNRAERKGIPWSKMVKANQSPEIMSVLENMKEKYEDTEIIYPSYYTRPFHGYDDGNLNWLCAQEGEAASLSMCVGYWKDFESPLQAEQWVRHNITDNMQAYLDSQNVDSTKMEKILDIGCSIGVSTEYLQSHFSASSTTIIGLDLSPYFISMAALRAQQQGKDDIISYIHGNAENMHMIDDSSIDMITVNYVFHELPEDATREILEEIYKKLKPEGVLAIIDLDGANLQDHLVISQFRKFAFEMTEPHVYGYYGRDMVHQMSNTGFKDVSKVKNDPVNAVWMAHK